MADTSKENKKVRALVMYSGGLDSRLAVKILEEQGIEVVPVLFHLAISCVDNQLPFHNNPKIIDCTEGQYFDEFMDILRNPSHGRGTAINPCVDCKIFMIKRAKKLMKELDCQILATGEVIGERPKSQHRPSLNLIQDRTEIEILRPLCAKELPETSYEKEGLVDRSKLHGITGRRRLPQFELAKNYGIQYPLPGGGCALCEKLFGAKMKHVLDTYDKVPPALIKVLKYNRLFYDNGYIIIAKNAELGDKLMEASEELKWNLIHDGKGPDVLYENKEDLELTLKLREAYSTGGKNRGEFDKYKVPQDKVSIERQLDRDHTPKYLEMRLNPEPFELMKSGKKTIELRTNDKKRKKLKIGDVITFTKLPDNTEKIQTKVTQLLIHKNFKDLIEKVPIEKLGYDNINTESEKDKAKIDILEKVNNFYSKDKQYFNKVVGIELELIK